MTGGDWKWHSNYSLDVKALAKVAAFVGKPKILEPLIAITKNTLAPWANVLP